MRFKLFVSASCCAFFAVVFLAGCGLATQESSYTYRLKSLDELLLKTDGDLKTAVEAEKKRIQNAYAKLPADKDARREGLEEINSSSYKFITQTQDKVKQVEKEKAAAAEKIQKEEFEKQLALIAGDWYGPGMHLLITADGTINYERLNDGEKTALTGGKITRIAKKSFDVKILVSKTTFMINSPPARKGAVWTMKVDGCELTRPAQ